MADVLMIAVVIGFFVLCVAYVALCERIVGDDVELDVVAAEPEDADDEEIEVAA